MLTAEGGPASPLPFIPSSSPLSIHPGSGILELFVSNTPQHYSPKAAVDLPRVEKDWDSCLFSGNQKNYLPTFPSFLPLSVGGTSPPPTSRGLRRIQGWQLPPGRAPSSRFLRILTPFSLFFFYIFFLSLFSSCTLYRSSQFRPCILSEC